MPSDTNSSLGNKFSRNSSSPIIKGCLLDQEREIEDRQPHLSVVRFWEGLTAQIDVADIKRNAMSVKGAVCPEPLRFLEIYANLETNSSRSTSHPSPAVLTDVGQFRRVSRLQKRPWQTVKDSILPIIPGTSFRLGPDINQPPYCWRDCDAHTLALNFTYNSSAVYRILDELARQRVITQEMLPALFDRVCVCLATAYQANNNFVMRHMNNNVSMFLVPKVIEYVLGKAVYDSNQQDASATNSALSISLAMLEGYSSLDIPTLMAIALGKGVAFMERHIRDGKADHAGMVLSQEVFHSYSEQRLAIDHRERLIGMVENSCATKSLFTLVAILDDTTETVDDLLWMLKLMEKYPSCRIEAIVNKARVSVNFSLDMMSEVLASPVFRGLGARLGGQFRVVPTYSPLLALQTNCLTQPVSDAIKRADVVYVKGANYFETLQLIDKDAFYAFIVHGPISVKYTGLKPYDAVFAYVPAGATGYTRDDGTNEFFSLLDITNKTFGRHLSC